MPLIEVEKFGISKSLYAINPYSFKAKKVSKVISGSTAGTPIYSSHVDAIWFKKSSGIVSITFGTLNDHIAEDHAPSLDEFIQYYSMARFGGRPQIKWNGKSLWSSEVKNRKEEDEFIKMLDPMLQSFPAVPTGWRGWFQLTD